MLVSISPVVTSASWSLHDAVCSVVVIDSVVSSASRSLLPLLFAESGSAIVGFAGLPVSMANRAGMPMAITLINVTVDPSDTGRSACSGFVLYALSGPNTRWRRIGFSKKGPAERCERHGQTDGEHGGPEQVLLQSRIRHELDGQDGRRVEQEDATLVQEHVLLGDHLFPGVAARSDDDGKRRAQQQAAGARRRNRRSQKVPRCSELSRRWPFIRLSVMR